MADEVACIHRTVNADRCPDPYCPYRALATLRADLAHVEAERAQAVEYGEAVSAAYSWLIDVRDRQVREATDALRADLARVEQERDEAVAHNVRMQRKLTIAGADRTKLAAERDVARASAQGVRGALEAIKRAAEAQFGALRFRREVIAMVDAALATTPPSAAGASDRFTRKLDELAALPEGWDSYGAPPIGRAAIDAIRGVLSVLAIVPCSSGGLQIEFHALGWEFELEVEADGSVASVICEERIAARSAPLPAPHPDPALGALVEAAREAERFLHHLRMLREPEEVWAQMNGTWLPRVHDALAAALPPTEAPR